MTILNLSGIKLLLSKIVVGDSAYVVKIPEFVLNTILLDFKINFANNLNRVPKRASISNADLRKSQKNVFKVRIIKRSFPT